MGAEIENGFGGVKTGWFIDNRGHGHIDATTTPVEEDKTHDGDALIVHSECHLAAATSGGLMALKNVSSDKEYHIGRVYVDGQTITPTDLIITFNISPTATITNGTDVSTTALVQKNTLQATPTASNLLTVTASDGSSDMTFSGSKQHHAIPIKTMESKFRDFKGTNVIGPGAYFIVGWKSAGTATDAEIVGVSVNFYVDTAGERF